MTKTMICRQIDDPVQDQGEEHQRVNLNDGTSHCSLYLTPSEAATFAIGMSYTVTIG